jgi:hypothetical protein
MTRNDTIYDAIDTLFSAGPSQGVVIPPKLEGALVINPVTYTFMGYEDVAVANHAMVGTNGTRYVKKGHVMGWGAVLGTAVVQKPGQLP